MCAVLLLLLAVRAPAQAQPNQVFNCPAQQQNLLVMPEIRSHAGKLKAHLRNVDRIRTVWGDGTGTKCAKQYLRVYEGEDATQPKPWPTVSDPLPGPTLRAKVGDLVEIMYFNAVNPQNFAGSLDHADKGSTNACDKYRQSSSATQSAPLYPSGDVMPNCLHGSSTSNVHFHGTHTTPSTTGDNVLLFVRPNRINGKVVLTEPQANSVIAPFFTYCEQHGPPALWTQMPLAWQNLQKKLLQEYDAQSSYAGQPGPLPAHMQLWPVNAQEIGLHNWPQYSIGGDPVCFPIPAYNPAKMHMGQAPGTHWYHAHKHGSTALNVANGMTGALIIEGQYDTDLRAYYGQNLHEQVLMLQQLGTAPFPVTNGAKPPISVNGRLDPVVAMRPGEVQLWRIVNGAFRDGVEFAYFQTAGANQCASTTPPAPPPVQWRQIAQDGVQFNVVNYGRIGKVNNPFNLAPANRADALVMAPSQPGKYTLCVVRNNGLVIDPNAGLGQPDSPSVLLTVSVGGAPVSPSPGFIPANKFPTFPKFLDDIPQPAITRTLVFGPGNSTIDGKPFEDGHVNQRMTVNTTEEWKVANEANDKEHPFHIHINPFQVIETFEPNAPEARDSTNPCYVDPNKPSTWNPCPARQPATAPGPPWWIWWDTFPIPTGQQIKLACTTLAQCPPALQKYTRCTTGSSPKCTEYIPGWFRMRTRFADFTGQYVLHCHILIHEDRGMMQLVEVDPDRTPYTHH